MEKIMAKKLAYLGAGAGLVLFTLFGLLYGSLLGGVVGLHLASLAFDPGQFGVAARIIMALGILFGVLLAALVWVAGSATLGYLVGLLIDAGRHRTTKGRHESTGIHHITNQ